MTDESTRNVHERFYRAERLNRLPYGHSYLIPADVAARCWPPTGDHDRSFQGTFRGLALMMAGNRPETSMTTIERIQRDLDESFEVAPHWTDGGNAYVVTRLLRKCPRCRGSGFYKQPKPVTSTDHFDFAAVERMFYADFEQVRCNHQPETTR